MSRYQIGVFMIALVMALGLYLLNGRPTLPDAPFSERVSEIALKDPSTLTPAEMLTRLQQVVRDRPHDAEPHYHIGVLLRAQGRLEDSVRAFQSALRRDDRNVAALVELADSLVLLSNGDVGPDAGELYLRAWRLDRDQVRPGILAGYSMSQRGLEAEAQALWAAIEQDLSEDDPRRPMFEALTTPSEEASEIVP